MIQLSPDQAKLMAQGQFLTSLENKLCRQIPEFSELSPERRAQFLVSCFRSAQALGLVSQQGIASYTLAAWWLGIGFEQKCDNLQRLFKSQFAEVRKVYAMNEYAHTLIGNPQRLDLADQTLRQAFFRSAAWR